MNEAAQLHWEMTVDAMRMVRNKLYPHDRFPVGSDFVVFMYLWLNSDPDQPHDAAELNARIIDHTGATPAQVEVSLDRLSRVGLVEFIGVGEGRMVLLGPDCDW